MTATVFAGCAAQVTRNHPIHVISAHPITVGRGADGIVTNSRRRVLAYLRVGT